MTKFFGRVHSTTSLVVGAHREKIGLKSKINQSKTKVSQKLPMWELGYKKILRVRNKDKGKGKDKRE